MAPISPPMDFTNPDIQDFISLNDNFVTADEAALVAAGIDPATVNFKVGGPGGAYRTKAISIRMALLRAVGSNSGPTVISVTHWREFGYNSDAEISRGAESIANAIDQYGEPHDATFEAMSVWQWLRDRNLLDPDYVLPKPIKSHEAEETHHEQTEPGGQMEALAEQVATLTERLQQAEKEIATLKAMTPVFRHITPALKLVAEIQNSHWGDGWKEATIPKQESVVQGLVDAYGLSKVRATSIDYVASPIDRSTGEPHK